MRLVPSDTWGILTVWQEARGEPFDGKVAVAEVILNRTRKQFASDGTVEGTVLRQWQFSGWNTIDSNRLLSARIDDADPAVAECIAAWNKARSGTDFARGALHYYNPNIASPRWAEGAEVLSEIGNHRFVNPR